MSVLVQRSVSRTLFSMAVPMLAGTFAMTAYNLTDTWFVARLGTVPLAAMAFTFPVVMLLSCVARGIGSGITTLVSHSIGRGDHRDAALLVTHGTLLTLAVTVIMTVGGCLLVGPVFERLGADEQTLPMISDYMKIWYLGSVFMTLPMMGNGVLISMGDSKSASGFMILGTVLNVILDPIMIFGLFGFPAMGISGAALATVVSQAASTVWMMILLIRKHRLYILPGLKLSAYLHSWRRIMEFGVPSILSMILMPISASVITKILSGFGHEAIAAVGAAGRVEMFAFIVPMALGISLTPFISQNFGARRMDRIHEARRISSLFALGYGGLMAVLFFATAPWLARLFSSDPIVIRTFILYIRIISFGYGMMELHRYSGFFLTGMHKPASATVLNAIRVVVFLIPLSYLGAHWKGIVGVFSGRLVTDMIVGTIGMFWVARALSAAERAGAAQVRQIPDRETTGQEPLRCGHLASG